MPAPQVDRLSIALKRALRCGIQTPRAASLVYTGSIVRDLRSYLRPMAVRGRGEGERLPVCLRSYPPCALWR